MKKIVVLLALVVCGCSHIVVDHGQMKVSSARERGTGMPGTQKYEYHVSDGSRPGWVLFTNTKFQIGDQLRIVKTFDSDQ